jgi:flotillin
VLNGAEGLSEVAAGLVAQGLTILDSVKKGMAGATDAGPDKDQPQDGDGPVRPGIPGLSG